MSGRVLVAGFSTRHVAQSAQRAGYKVCAVDHFCDQDLSWYTEDRIRFEELEDLPDSVSEIAGRHRFDMLVTTSGAEDMPSGLPVCGTPPEKIRRFLDKLETQHFFEELRIPVPNLLKDRTYPAFFKPRRGAGGWRNAVITNDDERISWETLNPDVPYIRQEIVEGCPGSVCCVTDGSHACAVASNEQMMRGVEGAMYGFAGSVTPGTHPCTDRMIGLAEQIAAKSGCVGTIGIDFMIGNDVVAIEVNPRFQATVDTVEAATGCNLFRLHVDACRGILPQKRPVASRYAARKILFAPKDMTIKSDLKHLSPIVADIPWPGTILEKDKAIITVFGDGSTREEALAALDKNITTVQQYLR